MKNPSTGQTAGILGGTLVLAGLILAVAALLSGSPSSRASSDAAVAATSSTSADPSQGSGQAQVSFTPDEGLQTQAIGPDGTPEPFWRSKQREAREEMLRSDQDGGVGVQAPGGSGASGGPASQSAQPADQTTRGNGALATATKPTTRTVLSNGQTPLAGVWGGTASELAGYLLSQNPRPRFTVPAATLAAYYVRYAGEVGLRADILWAQMIHETGAGAYGGDVDPAQNNYAGIGATGGGAAGMTFATAEAGVKAHVAHMVAYVFTGDRAAWTNSLVDPRYDSVNPRGIARVLSDLDGRWAVPGLGYGARIERHVAGMNP